MTFAANLIPAWEDGHLRPVDKLAVHQRGLRHPAISVFVMRGRLVLLQQRALGKYHTPGLWTNTCCTHPHWEEPPEVCARRRLKEELGITGLTLAHAGQVEYRADVQGGLTEHEVVQVYLAQAGANLVQDPNPAEVMATDWMDLDTLAADTRMRPDRYTPWLRIYLDQHRQMIFGTSAA